MQKSLLAGLLAAKAVLASEACSCDTNNEYYVKDLPELVDGQVQPCSYAGTMASNADGSHQLFFWMFPSEDPDAPVAIWLNGGPGASSSFGLFLENGPLVIKEPSKGSFEVYANDNTWAKAATTIFIDQPVGTGFSYGDSFVNNLDDAASEFVTLLTNLWEEFECL